MTTKENGTRSNGKTWCIDSHKASQVDLQNAIDCACGSSGNVDCIAIQPIQCCFEPDNLVSTRMHHMLSIPPINKMGLLMLLLCSFGGTGVTVDKDPIHEPYCEVSVHSSSESKRSLVQFRRYNTNSCKKSICTQSSIYLIQENHSGCT